MKPLSLTVVSIVLLSLSCSKDPASNPDPDPNPVLEDTWYTWTGEYTPSPADTGKSWKITINYNLPPKRDIAIDLPSEPFATKKL
jgi:hypothetical protein